MAKGYIGESGADKALDRMDKFMQRNKQEISKGASTLLDQLKAIYPDTWEEELEKMRKEYRKK